MIASFAIPLMPEFQLAEPSWLLVLLPMALLPVILWLRGSRVRGRQTVSLPWSSDLPKSGRQRFRVMVPALQVLGICAWALALVRPVELRTLPAESPGIDILLAIDRSSSMAAEDDPGGLSRLEVVQEAAVRFATGRPDDRLGVLSFARYPDLLTPPTTDQRAVATLLRSIAPEPNDSAEDMTGIGAAVARGSQVLARSGAKTRVLILWTDGEENVATKAAPKEVTPAVAAQLCQRLGVRVHVVRAGSKPGANTPQSTSPGALQMQRLAEQTGGRLFPVEDSNQAREVFATIDQLERSPLPQPTVETIERALPVVLLGALLWLVALILGRTRLEVLP